MTTKVLITHTGHENCEVHITPRNLVGDTKTGAGVPTILQVGDSTTQYVHSGQMLEIREVIKLV